MKYFIDTNIIVYNYSGTEPDKFRKASDAFIGADRVCSTQVLSELMNVLSTKFRFSWDQIEEILKEVIAVVDVSSVMIPTIKSAVQLSHRYRYTYYDSLILAAAIESHCNVLYSEDFQDGQEIEGVRIVNPFGN